MHIHRSVWYWYTLLIFPIKRRFSELSRALRAHRLVSRRVIKLRNKVLADGFMQLMS